MTKGQLVNYVTRELKSSLREIALEIRLNDFFYEGKYFFTNVRYGIKIENEDELKRVLINNSFIKRKVGNRVDFVSNMKNLNLNDQEGVESKRC